MSFKPTSALVLAAGILIACSQKAPEASAAAPAAAEQPVTLEVPAGVYKLDPTHAILQWSIQHFGLSNYTVKFAKYDAEINLDPAKIENSTVSLTIDPKSVRTDYPGDYKKTHANTGFDSWDQQIAEAPNFLNARKFGTITFKSTRVERSGPRSAKVTGDLTFLGVTKPVVMNVSLIGQMARHPMTKAAVIGIAAQGELNRFDFGMPQNPLPNTVKIMFDGEFHQAPAAGPAKPNG